MTISGNRSSATTAVNGSSAAGLRVEHNCPQCGGPFSLEETERFLQCSFCRVRLLITSPGPMRFVLAPKNPPAGPFIHIPYWRFRGMYFNVKPYEVTEGTLDTSWKAAELDFMPPSLGLRAQAMRLRFASEKMTGSFVMASFDAIEARRQAGLAARFFKDAPGEPVFLREFVAEAVSTIYAPIYIKGSGIFDAVTARPIARLDPREEESLTAAPPLEDWGLLMKPAQCPRCGWDLHGGHESVVFLCPNCDSGWALEGSEVKEVPYILPRPNSADIYIPFWRVEASIDGISLGSWADMVRFGNLPVALAPRMENEKLSFWFPGIRLSPRSYMRLSRTLTLARPDLAMGTEPGGSISSAAISKLAPVSLGPDDAAAALKVLLAELAVPRQDHYPLLSNLGVALGGALLYFIPFEQRSTDYVHPEMGFGIQKGALRR